MQVRAIVEATIDCLRSNIKALPEIMIPLVGTIKELTYLREQVEATIAAVKDAEDYKPASTSRIGTMIEIPRAAITADEISDQGRLLQLRHQRPHADDLRLLA